LKRRFLEIFGKQGNITVAAEATGIHRNTVYAWQEHDDEFAAEFRLAEQRATEVLEAEAWRRAVDGDESETPIYHRGRLIGHVLETKRSDTLLIFLLKARAPEKYRERVQLQHADAEGGKLDLATLMQRAREYLDAEQPA
jgi:hypothetical protein